MNWFANWYLREGPGISKGLPEKRGLALFAQIAGREAVELFKLNLLVILFSLPLVTAFAAHGAGLRIAGAMVRDENVYLREDFVRAFRELLVAATLAGTLLAAAIGLCGYAAFVYGQMAASDLLFAAPFTLALVVTGLLCVFAVNLFAALAAATPLADGVRLAFAATLAAPLPVLGALAFTASLWIAHVLFYPASVFMPVACNFSLGLLAFAFAARASAARAPNLSASPPARPAAGRIPSANGVGDAETEEHACVR